MPDPQDDYYGSKFEQPRNESEFTLSNATMFVPPTALTLDASASACDFGESNCPKILLFW